MDLKDDSLMMGAFSGPGECVLPMSYHDVSLPHSLDPQQQHSPGQSMPGPAGASVSLTTGLMSQPQQPQQQQQSQQSQSAQSSSQTQTTATPVISLFKLKNF